MTTNFTQKNSNKFECIFCDFKCCNKNDYNRHILTRKHKLLSNTTEKHSKNSECFICECGKEYKHHSSLWKHQNTCNIESKGDSDVQYLKDVTMMLITPSHIENAHFHKCIFITL